MPWFCRLLALACLAGVTASAHADEWVIDSAMNLKTEYNDNFRLSVNQHEAVTSMSLAPSLSAARNTEVSSLKVRASLDEHAYTGPLNPSRTDAQFSLNYALAAPLDTYTSAVQFLRDSTFDTELRQTGVQQVRTQRNSLSLAPGWTHNFTERWSGQLQVTGNEVNYAREAANTTSNALSDYRTYGGGATLSYRLTEEDKIDLALNRMLYKNALATYRSRSDDLRLAWKHEFSERMSGSLSVSRDRSRTAQIEQFLVCPSSFTFLCTLGFIPYQLANFRFDQTNFSSLYNASLQYQLQENWSLSASARREVQPSGGSSLVKSEALSLVVEKRFSETMQLGVDYTSTKSQGVGRASVAPSRYQSLGAKLSLGLSLSQGLEAGIRRTQSENIQSGNTASSNQIYLVYKQEWPPISVAH
jgi:hypothetical protein